MENKNTEVTDDCTSHCSTKWRDDASEVLGLMARTANICKPNQKPYASWLKHLSVSDTPPRGKCGKFFKKNRFVRIAYHRLSRDLKVINYLTGTNDGGTVK